MGSVTLLLSPKEPWKIKLPTLRPLRPDIRLQYSVRNRELVAPSRSPEVLGGVARLLEKRSQPREVEVARFERFEGIVGQPSLVNCLGNGSGWTSKLGTSAEAMILPSSRTHGNRVRHRRPREVEVARFEGFEALRAL